MTAPGWYPAPNDPSGTRRWWDGRGWTAQTQTIAPPAPPLRPVASLIERVIARAIDFVLIMILASAAHRVWAPRILEADDFDTEGLFRLSEILPNNAAPTVLLATVIIAVVWELYWLLAEGATPGKQLLGLYVSDPSSVRGTVELMPGLKRNLHRWVAVIPFGWLAVAATSVGSLVLMFDDRVGRQSLMDRFANTTVHRLPSGSPRFTPWLRVWLTLVIALRGLAWIIN